MMGYGQYVKILLGFRYFYLAWGGKELPTFVQNNTAPSLGLGKHLTVCSIIAPLRLQSLIGRNNNILGEQI